MCHGLTQTPGKHLLFLHSGVPQPHARFQPALRHTGKKENESPARKCTSESLSRNGTSSRAYIASIFNPLPLAYHRASSRRRSGSKPGSVSCSHADSLKPNQASIQQWWPGSESNQKKGIWKSLAYLGICIQVGWQCGQWTICNRFNMMLPKTLRICLEIPQNNLLRNLIWIFLIPFSVTFTLFGKSHLFLSLRFWFVCSVFSLLSFHIHISCYISDTIRNTGSNRFLSVLLPPRITTSQK